MENLLEFGKFIGLLASLFAFVVLVGGGIGIFFCWLGEKRADCEIRAHDLAVKRKMEQQKMKNVSAIPVDE